MSHYDLPNESEELPGYVSPNEAPNLPRTGSKLMCVRLPGLVSDCVPVPSPLQVTRRTTERRLSRTYLDVYSVVRSKEVSGLRDKISRVVTRGFKYVVSGLNVTESYTDKPLPRNLSTNPI